MNREDIIRMAVDAGIIPWTKHEYVGGKNFSASDEGLDGDLASLIQFAALVAKHTLANIDPSSFMSWQEGYEAGKQTEREACAKVCDVIAQKMDDEGEGPTGNIGWVIDCADSIRARGQA